jgi:hypothetical protein
MAGAFLAGRRYQAHNAKAATVSQDHPYSNPAPGSDPDPYAAIAKPIKPGDTLVISEKEAADHEVAWCKAHPNTKWIVLLSTETLKHIQEWVPGADDADIRVTGLCDLNGNPWKDVRTFGKD